LHVFAIFIIQEPLAFAGRLIISPLLNALEHPVRIQPTRKATGFSDSSTIQSLANLAREVERELHTVVVGSACIFAILKGVYILCYVFALVIPIILWKT
jgi:hypothetical protein